eukprot:12405062-Ditylum_brightwellii.AAC.1
MRKGGSALSMPLKILLPEYDPRLLRRKMKIGVTMKNNRDFEYEFAQNVHGKVVPKYGSYLNRTPTRTIPKYETESHFLFGVAAVPLEGGRMVGRRLKLFVYTNKKVVSYKGWEEAVHMEVLIVRRGGSKNKWVKKGEWESGKIWEEDD